eukprot:gb/GECG01009526.1/.p1 GENE.gb/GECG01009526.1/~~gb/GECG01009526.1/.p1  ORF type:complete len:128 (+),score=21.08 gb/GECG01009526.1/:1-384(+)
MEENMIPQTLQERQKQIKGGLSIEDGRRRRVQHSIELRKNKRQESLQKRRNLARTPPPAPESSVGNQQPQTPNNPNEASGEMNGLHEKVALQHLQAYAQGACVLAPTRVNSLATNWVALPISSMQNV